jgi:hypothetical protein
VKEIEMNRVPINSPRLGWGRSGRYRRTLTARVAAKRLHRHRLLDATATSPAAPWQPDCPRPRRHHLGPTRHPEPPAAGLDPAIGLLHTDADRRPSLALDVIGEFRPLIVDQVVVAAPGEPGS